MTEYQPKLADKEHQQRARDKMRGHRVFALLMAMRTGKTKTTLDDFGELELAGEVSDLLVIAPKGGYLTWPRQIPEHVSDDLLERALVHVWETSGGKEHDRALKRFLDPAKLDPRRPRMLIANVEAISARSGALKKVLLAYAGQRWTYTAVDESTIIKNFAIKRTKFMVEWIKPKSAYRRILSGLPAPRDPLDLYAQFSFLDRGILRATNYWEFRARYAIMRKIMVGMRSVDIVVGFKGVEEIYRLIEPHSFRVTLDDIVQLPVSYEQRDVTMTPEQQSIYSRLREEAIAELEGGGFVTGALIIVRMLRLHQVLMGYVRDAQGKLREIPENRTQALMDLIEEWDLDETRGKVIIWVSYDYSVNKVAAALARRYGEKSVACFWGGNPNTRENDDLRFTTDEECLFMVATPGAGGRSRKWDVANLVIYYSNTDNLEHRDQSEERAKDMSKTDKTTYIDLCVPGTVDSKIIGALRRKINLAATVTGDDFREWLV